MGFGLKSWLKRLVCARPNEPLTPTDWRNDHFDEPLNEQELRDLQETIESHSGHILLRGHALRKYEERLARLAKIYQRTTTLPLTWEEEHATPRVALEGVRDRSLFEEGVGAIADSPVIPATHLELPQQHSPESIETVKEEEQLVRPQRIVDDINHLEREIVASFSPRQLARGNPEIEVASRDLSVEDSSTRKSEDFPSALLKRTQSIAGTSDIYADEFRTPCEPGFSPSDIDASPPRPGLSPRLEEMASLGVATAEFEDRQPMHVSFTRDYYGQKPSRPLLSDDPLNDVLLFHSDAPPLSPNSESVRKVTSGFYRDSFKHSPAWKVKNANFAAADIRATSDSAGSMWEDDRLTRRIPEKVESRKLVFDEACA